MARKRLGHTRNYSKNVRNSIIDKRTTSLFKKAEELSILCDLDVAIIIFVPGEIQPIVWQSESLAKEVLMRYLSFPEAKRLKKLVKHETYLLKKVNEQEKRISKIQKMNEEKEIQLLFNQVVEGRNINELDSREIKGFLKVSAAKMDKLNDRKKIFNQQHQPSQPQNSPSNFKLGNGNVTPSAIRMEYLINDPWFVETMATNQNDLGLRAGSTTEPAPTKGYDINAKDDGNSKDLD